MRWSRVSDWALGCTVSILGGLVVVGLSSCECEVEVHQAYWEPAYLCTGDTMTLHYAANSCLEEVKIRGADGTDLGSRSGNEGSITTDEGILPEHLPLSIEGITDEGSDIFHHDPTIIDDPQWTATYPVLVSTISPDQFYETGQPIWAEERRLEFDREVTVTMTEGESTTTVNVYTVYDKLAGFTFKVPSEHFADRARAIQADFSANPTRLEFRPPESSDMLTVNRNVPKDSRPDWDPSHVPGGTWTAMVPAGDSKPEYIVGEQYGDEANAPKPPLYPEQGFTYDPQFPGGWMKLKVRCDTDLE